MLPATAIFVILLESKLSMSQLKKSYEFGLSGVFTPVGRRGFRVLEKASPIGIFEQAKKKKERQI